MKLKLINTLDIIILLFYHALRGELAAIKRNLY